MSKYLSPYTYIYLYIFHTFNHQSLIYLSISIFSLVNIFVWYLADAVYIFKAFKWWTGIYVSFSFKSWLGAVSRCVLNNWIAQGLNINRDKIRVNEVVKNFQSKKWRQKIKKNHFWNWSIIFPYQGILGKKILQQKVVVWPQLPMVVRWEWVYDFLVCGPKQSTFWHRQ